MSIRNLCAAVFGSAAILYGTLVTSGVSGAGPLPAGASAPTAGRSDLVETVRHRGRGFGLYIGPSYGYGYGYYPRYRSYDYGYYYPRRSYYSYDRYDRPYRRYNRRWAKERFEHPLGRR